MILGGRLKSPHTMEIPFTFDIVMISARITGGGKDAIALADNAAMPGLLLRDGLAPSPLTQS